MNPILIQGNCLPDVWEQAVKQVYKYGRNIPTEYDKNNSPPSKDSTVIMYVDDPFTEPRYHKNICMGLDDLYIYIKEVIEGINDYKINPKEGYWSYTYHQRLFEYITKEGVYNQIDYVISTLKKTPYSRRAIAITFEPGYDYRYSDPPCLQLMVFRILDNKLNLNVHMRSNDLYKATFPNMIAFTELQKIVADTIGVPVGNYTHIVDSMHIYGEYFKEVEQFLNKLNQQTITDRTWRSDDEVVKSMFEYGEERIKKEWKYFND